MTTARGFLRRLLSSARGGARAQDDVGLRDPGAVAAADRLEAAKQRLKQEIPPVAEEEARRSAGAGEAPGSGSAGASPASGDAPPSPAPADVDVDVDDRRS